MARAFAITACYALDVMSHFVAPLIVPALVVISILATRLPVQHALPGDRGTRAAAPGAGAPVATNDVKSLDEKPLDEDPTRSGRATGCRAGQKSPKRRAMLALAFSGSRSS